MSKLIALAPTTKCEEAREIGIPAIVMASLPGRRVALPTKNPDCLAVYVVGPILLSRGGFVESVVLSAPSVATISIDVWCSCGKVAGWDSLSGGTYPPSKRELETIGIGEDD